jgi:hypothetical protein
MPIRPSKNVVQKIIEFPPELAAEVETFAESRGLPFKAIVLRALRRHLDHPPPEPPPDPPLPPCEPDPPKPAKKPRAKKK